MAEIIFGIDHGNGNMKGENVCFPCGLVRYVSEPGRFMNEDILEYQGTYYTLSDNLDMDEDMMLAGMSIFENEI